MVQFTIETTYDALFFHIQSKTHFKIHILRFLTKKVLWDFRFDNFEEIFHQFSLFEREKTDLKFQAVWFLPILNHKKNGILLPKLFWPTVRKKCSSDREKLLKFEIEGREFANFWDH